MLDRAAATGRAQKFHPRFPICVPSSCASERVGASRLPPWRQPASSPFSVGTDDVENLSQIWAVAPALVKFALRDVQPSQKD
jgi:hypothetical protein